MNIQQYLLNIKINSDIKIFGFGFKYYLYLSIQQR